MAMTEEAKRRPNWILRGFIFLSAAFHLVLLAHISGLYDSRALTYIELTMQDPAQPAARAIPRPPHRPRPAPPDAAAPTRPVRPAPAAKPAAPAPVAAAPSTPSAVTAPVSAHELHAPQKPAPMAWSGPLDGGGGGAYGSSADYFSMVRMKIESNKQYPPAARKRQIRGRVKLKFTIGADGRISEVTLLDDGSHPILNQAALEALRSSAPFPRPPAQFFKGPVTLELSISFELV